MPASPLLSMAPRLAAGLCVIALIAARPVGAQPSPIAPPAAAAAPARDGQHDFDWMAGTWKAHLKRLVNPLTGLTTWVELAGTQRTWHSLGGRACMDEFTVENPADKTTIEALTTSAHFEQAFSTDAGKTWEVNWIRT